MNRRRSTPPGSRLWRSFACALGLVLLTATMLPGLAAGQNEIDEGDLLWQWQLLEYRDANGTLTTVPPGIGITALLYADTITVEGACSTYEGAFTQNQESLRIDPPTAVPGQGCDAAAQAIDDAFYQGLADTRTWSTSGSVLTLSDEIGSEVMTLTRAELPADPTLARWELARIGAADGSIQPVIAGVEPWLEFLRGGRIVGGTGCGSFLGSYTVNDSTMSISDVQSRITDCTEALQGQAVDILDTFAEVTDFVVLPAGLVLEDGGASTRLAFVPAIDLANRTWTPTEVLDPETGETQRGITERLDTSAVRFAGQNADGRTFCRGFDGGSLRSGLALSVSDLVPDEDGACPKAAKGEEISSQDVEDAFLTALQRSASHALRGDELELMDVQGRPLLRLIPQSELVGPTWVVTEMDVSPRTKKARLRAPVGEVPLTATFEDIGVLQGSTGASDYFASFTTPGAAQVSLSAATSLTADCGGRRARKPQCRQEAAFLALLQSADSFIVRPEEMRLFKGTRPILTFVPAEAVGSEDVPAEETPEEGSEGEAS